MDPCITWKKLAYKLKKALTALKCTHAPGCDARSCDTCMKGYEASELYGVLANQERGKTEDWESVAEKELGTEQSVRVETTLTNEMIVEGAAEEAWGQIVRWTLLKKIQGNLTYEEVRKVYEPLFLEAIRKGVELVKLAH